MNILFILIDLLTGIFNLFVEINSNLKFILSYLDRRAE